MVKKTHGKGEEQRPVLGSFVHNLVVSPGTALASGSGYYTP